MERPEWQSETGNTEQKTKIFGIVNDLEKK
jgi:hypothetical protein